MLFTTGNKYYFEIIHKIEIKENKKEDIVENLITALDIQGYEYKDIVEKVVATFVEKLFDHDGSERLLFKNAEINVDNKSHKSLKYSVPTSFLTNVLDL
jgi:hypothetical protein